MNREQITPERIESVRKIVKEAGGSFIGIQQDLYDGEDVVVFLDSTSRYPKGVALSEFSLEKVEEKLSDG